MESQMMDDSEFETMRKELCRHDWRYYRWICLERLRDWPRGTSVRIVGAPDKIRSGHFLIADQNYYRFIQLTQCCHNYTPFQPPKKLHEADSVNIYWWSWRREWTAPPCSSIETNSQRVVTLGPTANEIPLKAALDAERDNGCHNESKTAYRYCTYISAPIGIHIRYSSNFNKVQLVIKHLWITHHPFETQVCDERRRYQEGSQSEGISARIF